MKVCRSVTRAQLPRIQFKITPKRFTPGSFVTPIPEILMQIFLTTPQVRMKMIPHFFQRTSRHLLVGGLLRSGSAPAWERYHDAFACLPPCFSASLCVSRSYAAGFSDLRRNAHRQLEFLCSSRGPPESPCTLFGSRKEPHSEGSRNKHSLRTDMRNCTGLLKPRRRWQPIAAVAAGVNAPGRMAAESHR